jgi:hypothetical protein
MSWRGDLVTVLLSLWLIVGIFVDGWAHNTKPGLETFFTPWHALFYSGFAATAAWILWSVWSATRDGRSWPEAVPVGYGYAMVGLVIFALSGLGDLTWHQIFGIEQSIGALLSPTHLGLFTGAFLVVTAPYRSAAGDPGTGPDPGLRRAAGGDGADAGWMPQRVHPAGLDAVHRQPDQQGRGRGPGERFRPERAVDPGHADQGGGGQLPAGHGVPLRPAGLPRPDRGRRPAPRSW